MTKRKVTGPPTQNCLSRTEEEELALFPDIRQATGSLPPERREHVELCEACQLRIAGLYLD